MPGGCPVQQPCVNGPSAAKRERRKQKKKRLVSETLWEQHLTRAYQSRQPFQGAGISRSSGVTERRKNHRISSSKRNVMGTFSPVSSLLVPAEVLNHRTSRVSRPSTRRGFSGNQLQIVAVCKPDFLGRWLVWVMGCGVLFSFPLCADVCIGRIVKFLPCACARLPHGHTGLTVDRC